MQFSIRAILALTLVCGGICGLMFGVPNEYVGFGLLAPWAALPGALIALLIYGRAYVRAFAIGAMPISIPASICALFVCASAGGSDAGDAMTLRIAFVVGAAIVLLAGATSAAIRWVLLPRRRVRPKESRAVELTDARLPSTESNATAPSVIAPPVEHAIGPIFAGRFAAPSETAEPRASFGQRIGAVQPLPTTAQPQLSLQTVHGELRGSPTDLSGKQI